MKYIIILLVILLVVGGIFLGFKLGKNTNPTSIINYTSSATSFSTNGAVLDLGNKGLTKVTSDIYGKKKYY